MHEDSGSAVPAQVEEPADFGYEEPTEAAELRIFLMPVGRQGKRGWIAALATRLRRGAYRARARRDHR
jgi:hypothetical protein